MNLKNVSGHLSTITRHKLAVMDLCFKVGLIRQGLLHDLSKYTPVEFKTGILYYQGIRSPNAAEKLEKGYSDAWLHHKGRNRHHFEYWIDNSLDGTFRMTGMKMPLRYVLEMACDRIAASKIYNGDAYTPDIPYKYYARHKDIVMMHEETKALLEKILILLRDEGEHKALAYMRWLLLHPAVYENTVFKG